MQHWPDRLPCPILDARLHAQAIMEECKDWRLALECVPFQAQVNGEDYARRLAWLLRPQGEA